MSTRNPKECRQTQRDRAGDLRERIPALLEGRAMTTKAIAAELSADLDVVYRVLQSLRRAGEVESKVDGRHTPTGRVGATWAPVAHRLPSHIPRDPWIWALHGAQP